MKYLILICLLSPVFLFASTKDSIGVKTVEGKVYIIHQIQSGETLFGIARKYGANPQEVIKSNPGSEKTIRAGEKLLIPTSRTSSSGSGSGTTGYARSNEAKFHTVAAGETLFKIASLYNIHINDLKSWNKLNNDNIAVGQKLIVNQPRAEVAIENKVPETRTTPVETPVVKKEPESTPQQEKPVVRSVPKETTKEPVREHPISNRDIVQKNDHAETIEGNPSNEMPKSSIPARAVTRLGNEIIETGKVEIKGDGELGQDRNFIIHPTAKIGTIVMITNTETGSSAFARVVANKPLQAEYVAIINPTLAQKLGISENTISIKVNYAQ